ncbi:hypothetical protein ACHAXS_005962 [Conticribra weissflogii]
MLNMRFSTAICVGAILSSTGAATDSTSPAPGSKVFSLVVDHKYHIFSFVELPRHSILSRIDHSAAASSLLRKQCASHSHDGSKATSLYMSKSNTSGDTLRQSILRGATMKMKTPPNDDRSSFSSSFSSITTATTTTTNISSSKSLQYIDAKIEDGEQETTYTYYIREGKRSEINEITNLLMDAFHPDSQPAFDSYIRRYKCNHLKMMFDAMDEKDRGLFVACAVQKWLPNPEDDMLSRSSPTSTAPSSSSILQSTTSDESSTAAQTSASTIRTESRNTTTPRQNEQIIGFCSIDGRASDPSSKIEYLTPSTLASSAPRPYLSDLGVSPLHRRRGIGESLVYACEEWTRNRGYNTLYLKVDERNEGAMTLYVGNLGYRRVKLPWCEIGRSGNQFDRSVLLEKELFGGNEKNNDKDGRLKRNRLSFNLFKKLWSGRKHVVAKFDDTTSGMSGPPL